MHDSQQDMPRLSLMGFQTGFPISARAKPLVVESVLLGEVRAELNLPPDVSGFGPLLEKLAGGDSVLAELIAPSILSELELRPNLPVLTLAHVLDIVVRGSASTRERLKVLLSERFDAEIDPASNSLYLAALFAVDGALGTEAVFEKLRKLRPVDRPAFVQRVLPNIFGRRLSEDELPASDIPLSSLEQIVRLAFKSVRTEDDNVHPSGVVFSPDERDDAESARGAAFGRLLNTPGRAGFDAIMRLTKVPAFPISQTRLRQFARDRAKRIPNSHLGQLAK